MKILRFFIILAFLAFVIESKLPSPLWGEGKGEGEFTVGIITLSPPEAYVVIEESKTKKKRLYKKGDYGKVASKDLRPLRTVFLDTIEYRYRPLEKKVEFVSEEFELIEVKDKKAILMRDYIEEPEKIIEERIPEEEVIKIEEEAVEEEPKEEILAKRLVAEFFFKIESKKISEYEWEISLPTTLDAMANFGHLLGIVIKKIDTLLEPEKGAKIYFSASLGKGILNPNGLLIESLSSNLRSKSGLKDDDLIKTINGKPLRTIQDVAALFSTFSGSPQTVTLNLVRDDKELTLSYYIK